MPNPEELEAKLVQFYGEKTEGIQLEKYDIVFLGKKLHDKNSEIWSILRIYSKEKNLPGFNGLFGVSFLHGRGVEMVDKNDSFKKTVNNYYIFRMSQIKRLLSDDNGHFLARACICLPEIGYVRLAWVEKYIRIKSLDVVNDFASDMGNYRKRKDYAQRKNRKNEWSHTTKESAELATKRAIKKLFRPFEANIGGSAAIEEYSSLVNKILAEMKNGHGLASHDGVRDETKETVVCCGKENKRKSSDYESGPPKIMKKAKPMESVDTSLDKFDMSTISW